MLDRNIITYVLFDQGGSQGMDQAVVTGPEKGIRKGDPTMKSLFKSLLSDGGWQEEEG